MRSKRLQQPSRPPGPRRLSHRPAASGWDCSSLSSRGRGVRVGCAAAAGARASGWSAAPNPRSDGQSEQHDAPLHRRIIASPTLIANGGTRGGAKGARDGLNEEIAHGPLHRGDRPRSLCAVVRLERRSAGGAPGAAGDGRCAARLSVPGVAGGRGAGGDVAPGPPCRPRRGDAVPQRLCDLCARGGARGGRVCRRAAAGFRQPDARAARLRLGRHAARRLARRARRGRRPHPRTPGSPEIAEIHAHNAAAGCFLARSPDSEVAGAAARA